MNCFVPGRIIVMPQKRKNMLGIIQEAAGQSLEIIYTIEDVLDYYHINDQIDNLELLFGGLPAICRVQIGEELQLAERISKSYGIKAAFPDFRIGPQSLDLNLNEIFLSEALESTGLGDGDVNAGAGVRVALLDSGVDPKILNYSKRILQYETDRRPNRAPNDSYDPTGHGTTVANILLRSAPGIELFSFKIMEETGTASAFITALFLAEASIQPEIYNLSFSINCDPDICDTCGSQRSSLFSLQQLRVFFDAITNRSSSMKLCPIIIAAAGNKNSALSYPASLDGVLAVGSCDLSTKNPSTYSQYRSVPEKRYLLAPGGDNTNGSFFADCETSDWEQKTTMFGTSFATPFVSAIAARNLAIAKTVTSHEIDSPTKELVLNRIANSANRSYGSYNSRTHGLGIARYVTPPTIAGTPITILLLGILSDDTKFVTPINGWTHHTVRSMMGSFWSFAHIRRLEKEGIKSIDDLNNKMAAFPPTPTDYEAYDWSTHKRISLAATIGEVTSPPILVFAQSGFLVENMEEIFFKTIPNLGKYINGIQ